VSQTLVLVHGFLGSAANWGPIVHRLKQDPEAHKWKIVVPELLGHGLRGRQGVTAGSLFTLEEMARDLDAQIPPGPIVALGHSFGLRPLLKLSSMLPDRIKAIIAEDASPVLSDPGYAEIRRIFDEVKVPFASREEAREALDQLFGKGAVLSRFLFSNIRERSQGQHEWRFDRESLTRLLEEARREPLWKEWADFAGPLFLIAGGESSYLNKDRLAECRSQRGQKPFQVIQIPQSGHWVHSEQPDIFVQELSKILKTLNDV
jgi:esterase